MEYKHADITGEIIAAAFEVHKEIGNGFPEAMYQKALEIEFQLRKTRFTREYDLPVFYKGTKIGSRRVDFLINDIIPIELKAVIKLEDVHLAQSLNYLEAFNLEVGLLINFGSKSLEVKRLYNTKYNPSVNK